MHDTMNSIIRHTQRETNLFFEVTSSPWHDNNNNKIILGLLSLYLEVYEIISKHRRQKDMPINSESGLPIFVEKCFINNRKNDLHFYTKILTHINS